MLKFACFYGYDSDDLSERVNNFLKENPNIEIVDMKVTDTACRGIYNDDGVLTSVYFLYREQEK